MSRKIYFRLFDRTLHNDKPDDNHIVLYETPVDRIVPVGKFAMYDLIAAKDVPVWLQEIRQIVGVHDGIGMVVLANPANWSELSWIRFAELEHYRLVFPGRMIFPPDAGMTT